MANSYFRKPGKQAIAYNPPLLLTNKWKKNPKSFLWNIVPLYPHMLINQIPQINEVGDLVY